MSMSTVKTIAFAAISIVFVIVAFNVLSFVAGAVVKLAILGALVVAGAIVFKSINSKWNTPEYD